MIARLGRWLGASVLLLAALQLLYLGIANLALNHEVLRHRLNLAMPAVSLNWSTARTWYPGHLSVQRLDLDIQLPDRYVAISLEDTSLRLAVWPLLSQRFHIKSLVASDIHKVVIDDYRISGTGDLQLHGLRWQQSDLAVERLQLNVENGTLHHDDAAMVESIRLDTQLTLAPLALDQPLSNEALHLLSGDVAISGRSDAYDVFNPYLAELDWLEINGHGALEGRLAIEHGRLAHGSTLRLDSPALGVLLDESALVEGGQRYRLRGAGEVVARIEHDETQLALSLDDMQMQHDDVPGAILGGAGFRLTLATPAVALYAPPRDLHHASLVWDAAELMEITALNHYLPATLPMHFDAGSALLQGRLSYHDETLQGHFSLDGDDVSVYWGATQIVGQLDLQLALAELDLQARRLDLSGSHFTLHATTLADDPQPLTTELDFPRARFDFTPGSDDIIAPFAEPMTAAVNADLEASGQVANLDMLDAFLGDVFGGRGLTLEGSGDFVTALRLENGALQPGSHLSVNAPGLGSQFLDFYARGDGQIHASVESHDDASGNHLSRLAVQIAFADARLRRHTDGRQLLQADELTLRTIGDTPILGQALREPHMDIAWHNARIPDVSILNAYLPHTAPLSLESGAATSHGRMSVVAQRAWGDASLSGKTISGHLLDRPLNGRLDLALTLRSADLATGRLDISGTRLDLQASAADGAPQRLVSRFIAPQAHLTLDTDTTHREEGSGPALASAALQLDGLLADISLLNSFLPEEHGLEVSGVGHFHVNLGLEGQHLVPGSRLRVGAQNLTARFLHYEAQGDGTLEIEASGVREALAGALKLRLPSFELRHQERDDERVSGRHLSITSQARHLDRKRGLHDLQTHISLPIIEIPDLAVFNTYLAGDAGITLLSGRATLATELQLDGMSASGQLRLDAFDARLGIEQQELHGSLHLDTRLNDGDLESMEFDASGSSLALHNVTLKDAEENSTTPGWRANLEFEEARLTWQHPLVLEASLALTMRDSGLLVGLFVDAARERRWLRELLTIHNVTGQAQVSMQDDSLLLRELAIHSGDLELLAHLHFHETQLRGAMYGRHGQFAMAVGLDDGERQWRWWRPRRWFESARTTPNTGD